MSGMFPRGHTHRTVETSCGGKPIPGCGARGSDVERCAPGLQAGPCNREPPSWLGERWLAGGPAGGQASKKASYNESQGQSREVWGGVGFRASFLPPHPSPLFLNDHDTDEDGGIDNDGHYDSRHLSH